MSGKTYAILGGGGSFGIHTALYLMRHANPKKVIGIGRAPLRPQPFSLGIENYQFIETGKMIATVPNCYEYRAFHIYHELDMMMEYLDKEKPDVIINFAAQGEGAVSWKNSWRFFETNCVALSALTEELMERDWLERFIQIGTSELYGSVDGPVKENAPIKPSSPYAASKAAFDLHLMAIHEHLEFPMNIIRPSNCYCPGQLLHRVIPKAVVLGLTGRKMSLHGGGKAEKSYLHARDLARAIYLVSESAPFGTIYNVGPVDPISIRSLMVCLAVALQIPYDDFIEVGPERRGQDSRYWLDSMEIWNAVGWTQEIPLDEGLDEMVEWGKSYLHLLKDWPMDYRLRA